MKAVIQRVSKASLCVNDKLISEIDKGLVVYFCVEKGDDDSLCEVFANKLVKLRIFSDEQGKMNYSVKDVNGQILFVSQFTLSADLSGGNRPFFGNAEDPLRANALYEKTAEIISRQVPLKKGVFGADMQINQLNDGPVTIWWEAK